MRIGQRKMLMQLSTRLRGLGLPLIASDLDRVLHMPRTWYVYWDDKYNFMRACVTDPCKHKLRPLTRKAIRWSGRASCAEEAFAMEQRRAEYRRKS